MWAKLAVCSWWFWKKPLYCLDSRLVWALHNFLCGFLKVHSQTWVPLSVQIKYGTLWKSLTSWLLCLLAWAPHFVGGVVITFTCLFLNSCGVICIAIKSGKALCDIFMMSNNQPLPELRTHRHTQTDARILILFLKNERSQNCKPVRQ